MVDESLLRPGVQVRIIDSWEQKDGYHWENMDGFMDHWLDKVMTISEVIDSNSRIPTKYLMLEDEDENGGGWSWRADGFSEIVYDPLGYPDSDF